MGKSVFRWAAVFFLFVGVALAESGVSAASASATEEIDAFNQRFTNAIRHMDNTAVIALWADDGVSLLPGMEPIEGKAAVKKLMDDVTTKMPGYKVISHENEFRGLAISGDWASEWALTTQVVQPPDGKPQFTIHGKMLLVLRREQDGWKIERESWTGMQ